MNELLAHSSTEDAPAQSYRDHVANVVARARCYLCKILQYAPHWPQDWALAVLTTAGMVHDLGKLEEENQQVLRRERKAAHLPINHVDAGVAYLLLGESYLAALMVRSHHSGLLDYRSLEDEFRDPRVRDIVDKRLGLYVQRHIQTCGEIVREVSRGMPSLVAQDVRLLFSCLVHADHGDTSSAAKGQMDYRLGNPLLNPEERLKRLGDYVGSLSSGTGDNTRAQLRKEFFLESCNASERAPITLCDAPVGSGKTTAVMAYLLRVAVERKLRRIFVVLPYTSIITQSASIYRNALTLKDENARKVVAEIHHRADFETQEARQLTALWDAPIVVTTAVAFFETLASNRPSTLRRLQNLPGSAIFLDEAHAMLPTKLLPLAWEWMCHLSDAGMCQWVMASGSLARFWSFPEFLKHGGVARNVPNVISEGMSRKLRAFERRRVNYRFRGDGLSVDDLVTWIQELEGPVILVLNTVHTAAVVAKSLAERVGVDDVYHLSTSLTPHDRTQSLERVQTRLKHKDGGSKWFLVATSCVEAGMDLSFRSGVREMASVSSLVQMAGRVNRNSEYEEADVWSFSFSSDEDCVTLHPGLSTSAQILQAYFTEGVEITAETCTQAMRRELVQAQVGSIKIAEDLIAKEKSFSFKQVAETFRVIDDSTELVVVDTDLIEKMEKFEEVDWRQIQEGSVRIRRRLLDKVMAPQARRYPEIWLWRFPYSSFLGYMEYILQLAKIDRDSFAIV